MWARYAFGTVHCHNAEVGQPRGRAVEALVQILEQLQDPGSPGRGEQVLLPVPGGASAQVRLALGPSGLQVPLASGRNMQVASDQARPALAPSVPQASLASGQDMPVA